MKPRLLSTLVAMALALGCVAGTFAAASASAQVLPPETTAPPATTAPPTTAAPTTEAPATTGAPATTAPAASTTAKPKASTTTIPPTTTTPDQLPTLPPLPNGQIPAPTPTTVAVSASAGTAKVSPIFPALSVGGFTVAFLILAIQFLWNSRRVRVAR